MPDLPEPTGAWPAIPMIETTDRVLGGANGPANAQARALSARSAWLKDTVAEITGTLGAAQSRIADSEAATAQALADAQAAAAMAGSADSVAGAAQLAAATAASTAAAAQAAATAAQTAAGTATNAASTAQTTAASADTKATAAVSTADAAQTAVAAKATRFDLGGVTILYTAALILGAGARSIEVNCAGAQVGDAIFVAPTGAIPDGYAVGAAQCLVAGKIRVSVVHPALALGANFSIPLRVFALR